MLLSWVLPDRISLPMLRIAAVTILSALSRAALMRVSRGQGRRPLVSGNRARAQWPPLTGRGLSIAAHLIQSSSTDGAEMVRCVMHACSTGAPRMVHLARDV